MTEPGTYHQWQRDTHAFMHSTVMAIEECSICPAAKALCTYCWYSPAAANGLRYKGGRMCAECTADNEEDR